MPLASGNKESEYSNIADTATQDSNWGLDKWEELLRFIFNEDKITRGNDNLYIFKKGHGFIRKLAEEFANNKAMIRIYPLAIAVGLHYEINSQKTSQDENRNLPISIEKAGYKPDKNGEYNSIEIIQDAAQKGLEMLAGGPSKIKEYAKINDSQIEKINWLSYLTNHN